MFSFLSQVILSLPAGPEAAIAIFDCPKSILRALLAFMYQGKVQVIGDKRKIFRNNSHDLIFPGAPRGPADLPQGGWEAAGKLTKQKNSFPQTSQFQVKGLIERAGSPEKESQNVVNMDVKEEGEGEYGFEEETKVEDEAEENEQDEGEEEEEEKMVNDLLAKSLGADAAKKGAERKVGWLDVNHLEMMPGM